MRPDRRGTEDAREAFDRLAPGWDGAHGPASWRSRAFRARVRYLRSVCRRLGRPRVLDLGCATGHHLLALSDAIAEGVGLDIAPGMIDQAQRNAACCGITNLEFRVADAAALGAPENTPFELAISVCTIEHVDAPQRLVAGAHRLLRPGGVFLVMTLHPANPMALLYRLLGGARRLPPAKHLSPATLCRLGRDSGFRLRSVRDFPYSARRMREGEAGRLTGFATILAGAYAVEFERG